MAAVLVAAIAFVAGAIPFSYLAARRVAGVDLRHVGSGTVSGTSLYRVSGFAPLAVAGVLEVAKGAVGPALAVHRPLLQAVCCGLAVAGHDWSPFLRGAGGRGISPAMGALLVTAWPGTVLLVAGMVAGRAVGRTGLASFGAEVALAPLLAATHGPYGAAAGAAVAVPMLTKRVLGNARPEPTTWRAYGHRLLFDHDPGGEAT